MLGADRLGYWAKQYGFGAPTGIDLPGEVSGIVPTNDWKQEALGAPMFPGETYQAGIGQGYDAVTPIQLINAYAALANGGTRLRAADRARGRRPGRHRHPAVRAQGPARDGRQGQRAAGDAQRRPRDRRPSATPTTWSTCRSRSPASPARPSSASATPRAACRTRRSSSASRPRTRYNGSFSDTDSELVVMAFAHDSRTVGNAATEIVKYFFQLHYDIDKDYRMPELLERGNFYSND